MAKLSAGEKVDIRDRRCFFRAVSEIPGYGRYYSADPRFPCSVAVPGKPGFVYHHWDSDFLLLTFNIEGDEDAAVFRLDLKQIADGDSLARKVIQGSADEVGYEEQRERGGFLAGVTPKARIRRGGAHVPGFTAHRVTYSNGWQRVFFMDHNYLIWSIHNRGIDDNVFDRVASSFRLLSDEYFTEISSG